MALVFVLFWNVDLHKLLRTKLVTQNAGDAAALMAARWQATTLNLIGDLNLMQAAALAAGNNAAVDAITNVQARLCFTGPMTGLLAAQQAAKNNRIHAHPDFTALLAAHAHAVRNDYPLQVNPNGLPLFPEPWPGAWQDYADMLDYVVAEGVAAAPDNARFFSDLTDGHTLLDIGFYEAIAGRTWCWFHHNAPGLLENYQEFNPGPWWPPLPAPPHSACHNSEIFGLGLTPWPVALDAVVALADLQAPAAGRGLPVVPGNATNLVGTWYFYGGAWTAWDALNAGDFPSVGPVKPPFDYSGADAAIRIQAEVQPVSPGGPAERQVLWTAAAKPFGQLDEATRPDALGLVLPAFDAVRLIPVDASSAPAAGSFNLDWRRHIELHLPPYMQSGPDACDPDCFYCRQLITWENGEFRDDGADWLAAHAQLCELSGGGGGPGGGSRRGH